MPPWLEAIREPRERDPDDDPPGAADPPTGGMTPTATADGGTDHDLPVVVGGVVSGVYFGGVGAGVAFPILPTLGGIIGLTPFVVGLVLSANRFSRLVTNTPAGKVIDEVGTRKPMIAGLLLQGITPFGYVLGLSPDSVPLLGAAEIFLLSRALWGVGSAFVLVGALSTVIHVTTPDNRGKWVGYFRGGQSLGFPSGLVVGGILSDLYGYQVAFGAAGVLGLFACVVGALVLPDVAPDVEEPARVRDLPGIFRSDPRLFGIGTINFGVRLLFVGILLATVVLYADANGVRIGGLSAVGVSGALLAVSILSVGATTVVAGNLSDRVGNRAVVAVPALATLALGFATLAFVPTLPGVGLGVVLIGVGVGGTTPPLMASLGDISPEEDVGKVGGVYNVFGDVGSTLGPLIALPVAARIGFRAQYLLCAGLVVVLVVVVARTLLVDGERRR